MRTARLSSERALRRTASSIPPIQGTIKRRLIPLEMFGTKMLSQAINTPRFLSLALSYLILGPIVERTEWQRTPRAMRCGLCDCRYKILALIVVLFIPALQVAVINIEQQHIT